MDKRERAEDNYKKAHSPSPIIFTPPKHQGDNEVCKECKEMTPHKYFECKRACTHLISWAINEFNVEIVNEMTKPPYDSVGGD